MSDLIYKQAAIDEVQYELEMINHALDSLTLDYNTRERLRQRKGEAREILNSIETLPAAIRWIPCKERLPEEREWIGTKQFGTTISDTVLITFNAGGTLFVKPLSLQNGELSRADKRTMDVFYPGWEMVAWMPLPEPYREEEEDETLD